LKDRNRAEPDSIDPWASLRAKVDGRKMYDAGQADLWLIVHNCPQDAALATHLWHEYWHARAAILAQLRHEVQTSHRNPFSRVYFADYSEVLGGCRAHFIHGATDQPGTAMPPAVIG